VGDLESTGEEQWRRSEIKWDGHRGAKPEKQLEIEQGGDTVSRPYVPPGTKKKGEG